MCSGVLWLEGGALRGTDFAFRPLGQAARLLIFFRNAGGVLENGKVEIQFATLFRIYKTEGVHQKRGPGHSPGRDVSASTSRGGVQRLVPLVSFP